MIEWVSYSEYKIKVCSQSLLDSRWLPLALISKSVGTQEHLTTMMVDRLKSARVVKSLQTYVSYGLLLLAVLASFYFSRGLDPRDSTHKPVERINPQ
jgi:hypothetical protein